MLGWLKRDPRKKLSADYHQRLEQAMLAQRKGDIRLYGQLTYEAERIRSELEALDDEK